MAGRTTLVSKSAIPGCWVAVALSYALNQSIFLAICHFFLSWLYVVYWVFSYTDVREWIMQWVKY